MSPLLVLLWLACARAQVNVTIASASQSVTNIVPLYRNRAERAWLAPNGMYTLFLAVNDARADLAVALSAVAANGTNKDAALAVIDPANCPIYADPAVYPFNATATQQFLCCQLAMWQMPGAGALMQQLYAAFLPGAVSFDWAVNWGVASVAQIRQLDVNNTNSGRCKDDTRIHVPEAQTIQSQSARILAGSLLDALQYAAFVARTVAACLAPSPPAVCLGTAPAPLPGAGALFSLAQSSPPYQQVCSNAALAAFEQYRTATTWCYVARRKR
jgi:hypothetical protein